MDSIINGVVSGMLLALLIGPVFFTLIQTSIERGFRSGFFVAVGVSLSDSFYIALAYLGIYQIFTQKNFLEYLAYIGGIVLLVFGFYYLFIKNKKLSQAGTQVTVKSPWKLIGKGFLINGLTPTVLIFWIGTVSVATTRFGYVTPGKAIPYFASIVTTVFTTDLVKAKLAAKLRHVLTLKVIRTLNIILGLAMIIFGGHMILTADNFTLFNN